MLVNEIRSHETLKQALKSDLDLMRHNFEEEKKEHHLAGFREGFLQGSIKAAGQLLSIVEIKRTLIHSIEEHLTQVISDIAKEIVAEELTINKASILSRINRALGETTNDSCGFSQTEIVIKVNPLDATSIKQHKINSEYCFKIVEDSEISEGSATIESRYGNIHTEPFLHLKQILEYLSQNYKVPAEFETCLENELGQIDINPDFSFVN